MFLKQISNFFILSLFFLFFFNNNILANENSEDLKIEINKYVNSIVEFSGKFIQLSNSEISEGRLFLKDKRIRIDYLTPSKITIVLSDKKAMYFNHELSELEYFNPNKTIANIFYDVFYNKNFFNKTNIYNNSGYLIAKKLILLDDEEINMQIYFEKNPLIIKKIDTITNGESIKISFSNLNYNPIFKKNFFSMANPMLD